jgi:hypothetical protein
VVLENWATSIEMIDILFQCHNHKSKFHHVQWLSSKRLGLFMPLPTFTLRFAFCFVSDLHSRGEGQTSLQRNLCPNHFP